MDKESGGLGELLIVLVLVGLFLGGTALGISGTKQYYQNIGVEREPDQFRQAIDECEKDLPRTEHCKVFTEVKKVEDDG